MMIAKSPKISIARVPVESDARLDRIWRRRRLQQSPSVARSLEGSSNHTYSTEPNNSNNNNNPSIAAKEDPNVDEGVVNNNLNDNDNNDDVTVVVPLNFVRGENSDDGMEEESSKIITAEKDSIASSSSNRTFWIGSVLLIFSIGGFFLYRSRELKQWTEYRTHQLLQAQDEAFDLSFQDEDDLELSSVHH